MQNAGRWLGLLVVLAVPVGASLYLYSRPDPGAGRAAPVPVTVYEPAPLYNGPPQDGLTLRNAKGFDVRRFAQLALYVPEGAAPSMFLPSAGAFTATWKGKLRIPTRERYTFTFVGTGIFSLRLVAAGRDKKDVIAVESDGAHITGKRVRLSKGELAFEATYQSPAKGPAIVRVYWECDEFAREPIPAESLSHAASPSLSQFARMREGRHLVAELRCGKCHLGERPGRSAPSLATVGTRLSEAYMAEWIANPDPKRMPRMLHGPTAARDAADLAAYLASLGKPSAAKLEFTKDEIEQGAVLYSDYGCVACHTLPDASSVADRLSLGSVAHRFPPAQLVDYLLDPARHNPGARMPNFGLDDEQARALAAFLISRPGRRAPAATKGDPIRGKLLAGEKGCSVCHGLTVSHPLQGVRERAIRGADVDCSFAQFDLTKTEQDSLREYLSRRRPGMDHPVELVERQVHTLRCTSCHAWRGATAPLDGLREEMFAIVPPDPEGHPHRPAPDLTYTGSKLRTEWLVRWLQGKVAERPRPWMHTRMPTFSMQPEIWAQGFAHGEGYATSAADGPERWEDGTALVPATAGEAYDPEPAAAAEMLSIGEKLIPREGGLGCIQCHAVGEQAAEEVFEAPGIDLLQSAARLRKEFYLRWVLDPPRFDPATKMTKFADEAGETGLTDVLDGNGRAQFDAIWRHLQARRR